MLLTEIEKKIEELKAQADAVKAQEKAQAIDAARAMIASYGITAKDLGLDKVKGKHVRNLEERSRLSIETPCLVLCGQVGVKPRNGLTVP
jgi:hypothetical protein